LRSHAVHTHAPRCCTPLTPQVSRERRYTPQQEDVGFVLKYEASIIDAARQFEACRPGVAFTSRVRPAPNLPQRALLPLPGSGPGGGYGRFTLMTYNILADLYAKVNGLNACRGGLRGSKACTGRLARGG
jgi:CCR4-NOT transcription complex subunit 6